MNIIFSWIYRRRTMLGGIMFVAGAFALAHAFWSSAGWNPALDGILPAAGRRVMEGQKPYLDFIWSRAPLSIWMHVPLLLWSGDCLFVCARALIWLQLAVVAWLWAWMIHEELLRPLGKSGLPLLACIAFAGAGFSFLSIAGDTANALFFSTVGLAARLKAPRRAGPLRLWVCYSLLGLAAPCKLGFWIFPPVAILALGDRSRPAAWLAAAWPMAALTAYLAGTGSFALAWNQAMAPSWSLHRQWSLLNRYSLNALYAYLAMRWTAGVPSLPSHSKKRRLRIPAGIVMWGVNGFMLTSLTMQSSGASSNMMIFWIMGGVWSYFLLERRPAARADVRIGFLAWWLSMAVCSFNPWHGGMFMTTGIMIAIVVKWIWCEAPRQWMRVAGTGLTASAWIILSMYVQVFHVQPESGRTGRYRFPAMLDAPRQELTHNLDGVLSGGAGLNTSSNVQAVLKDLNVAVSRAEETGRPYAILPDMAGHWARARAVNPLPIDWAGDRAARDSLIQQQLIDTMEARRGELVIIVQKVQGRWLWRGFRRQGNWPAALAHVRRNFERFEETEYFELYQ